MHSLLKKSIESNLLFGAENNFLFKPNLKALLRLVIIMGCGSSTDLPADLTYPDVREVNEKHSVTAQHETSSNGKIIRCLRAQFFLLRSSCSSFSSCNIHKR